MVRGKYVYSKTYSTPRRPYEKERLDAELKLIGEFGLRNKREVWRAKYTLAKIRKVRAPPRGAGRGRVGAAALTRCAQVARELLKLDEKDPRRLFEGNALLRRVRAGPLRTADADGAPDAPAGQLVRIGVLDEQRMKLDYVLGLKIEDLLARRLQTRVFKLGMAKSVHHARVLIRGRHIRVGKQLVNVPSFIVRLDSDKHIDFALTSPLGGGRPGRTKRKNQRKEASAAAGRGGGDEADA